MKRPWVWLEHTADMGFRARGASEAELFENAAAALVCVVLDPARARGAAVEPIAVEASGREELLVHFLNEILYLLDGRRLAVAAVRVLDWNETRLRAEAAVEPRDDQRHPPRLVVKAVTFHQLAVAEEDGAWRADVFLDI